MDFRCIRNVFSVRNLHTYINAKLNISGCFRNENNKKKTPTFLIFANFDMLEANENIN